MFIPLIRRLGVYLLLLSLSFAILCSLCGCEDGQARNAGQSARKKADQATREAGNFLDGFFNPDD